jgi:glycosyltransferase involved in cell wall biosynthesis
MMEAMLAGCVPVVADRGGPGEIVTDECGFRIPVTSPDQMVNDLCDTILHIDSHRDLLVTKGPAAERRIAENYNEQHYRAKTNALYAAALETRSKSPATLQK